MENIIKIITDEDFGKKSVDFNNPKIRWGARGIVIGKNNKIAIFNKSNKNEYKLPGGGIEGNEDPKDAFKREVLEETGCEIEIIKELGIIKEHRSRNNFQQTSYVFVAKVITDTNKLNLTQKEKDEGALLLWVNDTEALEMIAHCYDNLKASKYEKLDHVKSIVYRDTEILKYYLNNKS